MMKSSLDHMPEKKQRELARALDILHEEFEDALKGGAAEFKKKGRILKIILFGSYARGGWVDEPYTAKGYRSDFDLLIVVNNRKLCDFAAYWYKAKDRIIRDKRDRDAGQLHRALAPGGERLSARGAVFLLRHPQGRHRALRAR